MVQRKENVIFMLQVDEVTKEKKTSWAVDVAQGLGLVFFLFFLIEPWLTRWYERP